MWNPTDRSKILKDIEFCEDVLSLKPDCLEFWNYVKIYPEKWKEKTMGEIGGGFWVVAIMGKTVIYYNDIEEGYNQSPFSAYGEINEYSCNQSELFGIIESLYYEIARKKI